jgi:ribonuclease VapC
MFVDASAIVAILTEEPEADTLANTLETAETRMTSPIAIYEAVVGVSRKRHVGVEAAQHYVEEFLRVARVETVPINATDAALALSAFARFGKGRGHPAQLNMGDCFAYASAISHRLALLFKGDDFSRTDIAVAVDLSK